MYTFSIKTLLLFLFKTILICLILVKGIASGSKSTFYTMMYDQIYYNVMWISLGHGLHDHRAPPCIPPQGTSSNSQEVQCQCAFHQLQLWRMLQILRRKMSYFLSLKACKGLLILKAMIDNQEFIHWKFQLRTWQHEE